LKNKIVCYCDKAEEIINKNIYGHFIEHIGKCVYGGIWVGEDSPIPNINGFRKDIVEALKQIKIPVLRWPGGCFGDTYHWRDGIGPPKERPKRINAMWGNVKECNHFGTHEFLNLCELLGCESYICGNVGSGTVLEMQEWVEYINSDFESNVVNLRKRNGRDKPWFVKYFGIGNESWGCGGEMRAEYYSDLYKHYQNFIYNYDNKKINKIACGPEDASIEGTPECFCNKSYNRNHWTEVLMREASSFMDGLSIHYYTMPGDNWERKGSATNFNEKEWFVTLKKTLHMEKFIEEVSSIMDEYDPNKEVSLIVDEWGTWYDTEEGTDPTFYMLQQNTMRDAIVAGINLNIFNNHCSRVKMANIAMMINMLQSLILTKEDKMILTPTYYVFDMFKVHQDSKAIPLEIEYVDYSYHGEKIPQISVSASRDRKDTVNVSICNLNSGNDANIECELHGIKYSKISGRILTAPYINSYNTFDSPYEVKSDNFNEVNIQGKGFNTTLPPRSVVILKIE